MGKSQQKHNDIDNDIVNLKKNNNDIDNDIVGATLKEKVLKEIPEWKLDHIGDYLFGNNTMISDCGAFINPAIKQIDRFMYVWMNELSDETRKIIVQHSLNGNSDDRRSYSSYTNSPLWKYTSSMLKLISNYTCERCKRQYQPTHLVVHHISYEHIGSELNHIDEVAVLCTDCHMAVHGIRRKV